ncbi:ParB/RepB/Spo0J family partition protein [Bradyrhizobium quebecense]|uniref:ParB/RepB/Spo0J family partition protein n=1 Tax=Bradyrhizobium quebecense TaxID=2748629 RepID=A0A973WN27_9BRAD|nr:ParB/RepB/Spo0J family partition protein [Bradyrhizobium quebecense]UGA47781.1 ParB/RepB/Spo0J family partition protein [Bradyrhizobium quebecense]
MDLQHIPLSNLKVAAVNVRHGRKPPDVSDILPSIRVRGVLQPLLVRPNEEGFEIIAGRRRYFAASKVAEEQGAAPETVLLPCAVTATGDDTGAMEASLIENVARQPMDELQEYEAFAKLLKQGRKVEEIAATFGVTELRVKQRLAIASLHPKIKEAFRAGTIEGEDLRLLTSATRSQQKEWVDALATEAGADGDGEGAPRGFRLKRWLFGGEQIATKVALFPLANYPGNIVTDLFGDVGYFSDHDAFWVLQNTAIAQLRDDLTGKGWQQVTVMERGSSFHDWQYDEVALEDGGHAFIEVGSNGEVEVHAGYRDRDERDADDREAQGGKATDTLERSTLAKAELTKAAENYASPRHRARRTAVAARHCAPACRRAHHRRIAAVERPPRAAARRQGSHC